MDCEMVWGGRNWEEVDVDLWKMLCVVQRCEKASQHRSSDGRMVAEREWCWNGAECCGDGEGCNLETG